MALSADTITIERPVTDHAQVLSPATVDRLEMKLLEHHQETGVQIAVLTVPTTVGVPIEDYSIAISEDYGRATEKVVDQLIDVHLHRSQIDNGALAGCTWWLHLKRHEPLPAQASSSLPSSRYPACTANNERSSS